MRCILDYRENALKVELINIHVAAEITRLDIGDVQIWDGDTLLLTIERKTAKDLASSVKDGRLWEQRDRIVENSPLTWYVIEGLFAYEPKGGIPFETLSTVLENMMLTARYWGNLWIHHTASTSETARLVRRLLTNARLQSPADPNSAQKRARYEMHAISAQKKKNVTPRLTYMGMLQQVRGVSHAIAVAIVRVYPTLADLVRALGERRPDLLAIARANPGKGAHWRKSDYATCAFLAKVEVSEGRTVGMRVTLNIAQAVLGA